MVFVVVVWVAGTGQAAVSVNVPIGDWSYSAVEKLAALGLIESDMRATRPYTRLEMARLTLEARNRFDSIRATAKEAISGERALIIEAILGRLEREFSADLGELSGAGPSTCIKPLKNVYLSYLYGNHDFKLENTKGEQFGDASNARVGLSSYGVFFSHLAYYLNPEYRYAKSQFSGESQQVELFEGYGKLEFFNIELEAGRDTLWWGPGVHGSLLLTDNAQPLNLIKLSNPDPVVLPWIFKYLGSIKFAAFWTELGDNGDVHQPELMGLRFDLKPLPLLEIGLARTWMLNGRGSGVKGATDLSFNDWMDILFKGNSEGELDVDQRAGLDAILRIPDVDRWLSLMKTFELWSEFYGEDEAGHLPSKWAYVVGAKFGDLFLTGKTDLILEYANDVINGKPGLWYSNQHYPQGYTYKGDILGHNMGSDARDYIVRLEQYLSPDLVLGLDYNRQERGVEAEVEEDINRFDLDFTYQGLARMTVRLGYRFETIDNLNQVKGNDQDNHIFWTNVVVSF